MSTYPGTLEDAAGNLYYPESNASYVKMADGSTAQATMDNLNTKYTNLLNLINDMNTNFTSILGSQQS